MILFFDTETTGLPKNWKAQFNSIQFNSIQSGTGKNSEWNKHTSLN
jgi:uncharacterized protein YprB with RNaseH-like and TPR domain